MINLLIYLLFSNIKKRTTEKESVLTVKHGVGGELKKDGQDQNE